MTTNSLNQALLECHRDAKAALQACAEDDIEEKNAIP